MESNSVLQKLDQIQDAAGKLVTKQREHDARILAVEQHISHGPGAGRITTRKTSNTSYGSMD